MRDSTNRTILAQSFIRHASFFIGACLFITLIFVLVVATESSALSLSPDAKIHSPGEIEELNFNFKTHDGYDMAGRIALAKTTTVSAVVVRVQSPQSSTIDSRTVANGKIASRTELFFKEFPKYGLGFCAYEGRGVSGTEKTPIFQNFEKIDRKIFDTSSLNNKTQDVISAIRAIRRQHGLSNAKIILMGTSEQSLVAAEAASRWPKDISGLIVISMLPHNHKLMHIYYLTQGEFLPIARYFDSDGDSKISKNEFDLDPHAKRNEILGSVDFATHDLNNDGFITVQDIEIKNKDRLFVVKNENFEVLENWAQNALGPSVPKGFVKDHYRHESIDVFLKKLKIPVGVFHGTLDQICSVEEVKRLQKDLLSQQKNNFNFHYYADASHFLGLNEFILKGTISDTHKDVFEFAAKISKQN